jgi:hypothetical protein
LGYFFLAAFFAAFFAAFLGAAFLVAIYSILPLVKQNTATASLQLTKI